MVVDSPHKAKTLARWLGSDVRLIACSGPVRALPRRRMGVEVKRGFTVEYEVPKARQKEARALEAAARGAGEVWLAAPPGEAGEAFCSLIARSLPRPREARRIDLAELTQDAFTTALRRRRPIDERAAEAVEARLVLDRLAGPALAWCLGDGRPREGDLGRLAALALAALCGEAFLSRSPESERSHATGTRRRDPATAPLGVVDLIEACYEAHGLSALQALRLADRLHEGVDLPGGRIGLITSPRSDGPGEPIRPVTGGPDPSSIEAHLSRRESWLYRLVWDGFRLANGDAGDPGAEEGPIERPWTEAGLIRELVESGVGPADSCLPIPRALEEEGLVEGGPAALRSTPAGRRAGARLREFFPDLARAAAVAALEAEVGALSRGERNRLALYGRFWKKLERDLGRVPRRGGDRAEGRSEGPPCERCGAPTRERAGPHGPFRACSNYPSCTKTQSLAPRAAEVGLLCPRCSLAPIVERLGPDGRRFYGCRAYPKCRFTTHHRPVGDPCPLCGQAFLLEKQTRREGLVRVCATCRYRARAPAPSPAGVRRD